MHPGLWHWANCVRYKGDLTVVTPGNKLCKFADDTYFIIPTTNEDTRITELEIKRHGPDKINMRWTAQNQIKLNSDSKRRRQIQEPHKTWELHVSCQSRSWGVPWQINHLCPYVAVASSVHVLRHYSLRATSHARPRYERFSAADNLSGRSWPSFVCVKCPRLEGFLRCSQRWGFCSQSKSTLQQPVVYSCLLVTISMFPIDTAPNHTFEELWKAADKQLFDNILANSCHLLNSLLPSHSAAWTTSSNNDRMTDNYQNIPAN